MKLVWQLFSLVLVVDLIQSVTSEKRSNNPIKYLLYTKSNALPHELITGNKASVKQSSFDSKKPTKIIIHGWSMSAEEIPNLELRSAYLAVGDYNLISVDWKEYATLNYISSVFKVPVVGADIAEFIDFLNESAGMSFASLVVIGHSLGAHCAGFAGKHVKRGRLPFIVGLDPASPLFSYDQPEGRLNSKDANYVETIQTCGGLKGFLEPIGSASFYPNWGANQPGCGIDLDGSCSHARTVYYYANAIRGLSFTPVYRCSGYQDIIDKKGCDKEVSKIDIGDPNNINKGNGIFYFKTNSDEPFGHK